MSKGSVRRPTDETKYKSNYDAIFSTKKVKHIPGDSKKYTSTTKQGAKDESN
jgi:hypothetical protein